MKLIITDTDHLPKNISKDDIVIKDNGTIRHCIGCFGCWVKTPGKCVIHDDYADTGCKIGACSELIIVSECKYGSVSPFVKNVMDRAISYIHPYFVIRKGEMHHKRRYDNVITMRAYFYGTDITEDEKRTACDLMQANVDNYDGKFGEVKFFEQAKELEEVAL